jgi:putative acetyltransferase
VEVNAHEPTLRLATNADADRIRALVFSVLREYQLAADPNSTDADLADIESHYFARGGCFAVLIGPDETMIGTVGLYPVNTQTVELRKMYLHPAHRGRGLGRRLMDYALAEAKARGFTEMTLETASVLSEAIRLYSRYGFRPYTADHLSGRCDQAYRLAL